MLQTAESKVEMFGYNAQQHIWRKPHKLIRTNTSNQLSRMVVEGFDLICDDFRFVYNYKTWEPYLVNSSLYQSILVRPPVSQGLGKTGSHSSKMIPSTAENSRK